MRSDSAPEPRCAGCRKRLPVFHVDYLRSRPGGLDEADCCLQCAEYQVEHRRLHSENMEATCR